VGFSPLTLADFRMPVPGRTQKAWNWERATYPKNAQQVMHDDCHKFSVTAFFFTRDMIRDHIQRLVDEYNICDPAIVQQLIDYYAEVTPQCGEAISWVWFSVDYDNEPFSGGQENRYFGNYLSNFKDKFHLEIGLPKVQDKVDTVHHNFLYQYQKRGKWACGPAFKQLGCQQHGACGYCLEQPCPECKCSGPDCNGNTHCQTCPVGLNVPADKQLLCTDLGYKGFTFDPNGQYVYYPTKSVIEDTTYDPVAGAYRWKFAWRFTDCQLDWLQTMCHFGLDTQMSLVLSDPTWFSHSTLGAGLRRDILASADPTTWGNVWPAGNLPFDQSCCPCTLPACNGECALNGPVGFAVPAEIVAEPEPVYVPEPEPYFEPEPEPEVVEVPGRG
jgi:hypothetical protein